VDDKHMPAFREIINLIKWNIYGRVACSVDKNSKYNLEVIMWHILEAGGGNHLEIGTLFGGSAIAAAIVKKEYNQTGMVVCVDPLVGVYRKDKEVTPETLFRNIAAFDVRDRIMVLANKSEALINLVDMNFTTAFIDGNHLEGGPLLDWKLVKDIVSDYVMFDDWGHEPAVEKACEVAISESDWACVYEDAIYVVKKRKSPSLTFEKH